MQFRSIKRHIISGHYRIFEYTPTRIGFHQIKNPPKGTGIEGQEESLINFYDSHHSSIMGLWAAKPNVQEFSSYLAISVLLIEGNKKQRMVLGQLN